MRRPHKRHNLSEFSTPPLWQEQENNAAIADEVISTHTHTHTLSATARLSDHMWQLFPLVLCLYVRKSSDFLLARWDLTLRPQTAAAATPGVSNAEMEMNRYIFHLAFGSSNYFPPMVRVETDADRYIFMNLHCSLEKRYVYCTASDNLFWKCISACDYVCSSERLTL